MRLICWRSCYRQSTRLAVTAGARSIAFPAISTGVYGYPVQAATAIAVDTVRTSLEELPAESRPTITFCCFDQATLDYYVDAIERA